MHLEPPVQYLIESDFRPDGSILPSLDRQPLFVMIQSSQCGHCETAKPDLQRLADSGLVRVMTIQVDGDHDGERRLSEMIHLIYPDIVGFPSYMMFVNGNKVPYTGRRDYESMRRFVEKF